MSGFPSGTPQDLAAAVYANGQADIFAVSSDCNIYSRHSTNGQTWGTGWNWWGSCGDKLDVAILPDGTGWAALRVPSVGNYVAVLYFNGSSWGGGWTYPPGTTAQTVNDVSLLAYSPPVCCAKLTLWAVGTNNNSIYYRNWDGTNWSAWTLWVSGYKQVSSFSTSDGGAYLLFIGSSSNKLSTERFTGTAWGGIMPQGAQTLKAVAGVNVDEDFPYEHTDSSDDCRVKDWQSGPICDNQGNCFWTQGVNLAEIIYNEARGETIGAQDTVGWTVRDRAFQNLSCGSYPGANTVCATPCNDPNFSGSPNNTQRYCCAMHGGQTQVGTSGYQFDDEHVDINTLSSSLIIWEAFYVGNGWVGDVSTSWCPPGVAGCSFACSGPGSSSGFNYNDPSPNGPMEFRANDYCAQAQSCKRYVGDICGNSGGSVPPDSSCGITNPLEKNDNFFWNRR